MQKDGHGANSCNKDKLIDEQVEYYDEEDKPCEMSVMRLISRVHFDCGGGKGESHYR